MDSQLGLRTINATVAGVVPTVCKTKQCYFAKAGHLITSSQRTIIVREWLIKFLLCIAKKLNTDFWSHKHIHSFQHVLQLKHLMYFFFIWILTPYLSTWGLLQAFLLHASSQHWSELSAHGLPTETTLCGWTAWLAKYVINFYDVLQIRFNEYFEFNFCFRAEQYRLQ